MTPTEAAAILRSDALCTVGPSRDARLMGAEALEILAWMEAEIGDCAWSKKSWAVIAGTPTIYGLLTGNQIGGWKTYTTMLEALRAAMKGPNATE